MRAIVIDPNAPARLSISEVDEPKPAPNQALVRLAATSLNRGEVRMAQAGQAGYRPGWDVTGTVVAAAADGSGPAAGARVVGLVNNGAWGELVAVPTDALAPIPEGVSFAQAAVLPVAGLTAYYSLQKAGSLLDRNVLVTGASGGVGHLAIQLIHISGGRAVGVVHHSDYASLVREMGAYQVVASEDAVKAEAYGPYDLVLDSVGGKTLANVLRMLAPFGLVVNYGSTAGRDVAFQLGSGFGRGGATLYSFLIFLEMRREPASIALGRLARLVAEGRLKPYIAVQESWKEAGQVAQRLLERAYPGKAVLTVE